MAGKIGLNIKNLRGVQANLRQYGVGAVERVGDVNENSMNRVYDMQQSLVAVKTGFMKSATRKELSPKRLAYRVGWRGEDFGDKGPYFVYVELGTRFQAAQPSLLPAWEIEKPRYMAELKDALSPRGAGR